MAATEERSISGFPTGENIALTTLLFGSVVNALSASGYDSVKILASDLANAILGDFQYTQDLDTVAKTIFGAINECASGASANGNIADTYSDQSTYAIGDYVIYNGALYRCITAVTMAESFDSQKWVAITVGDDLSGKMNKVDVINLMPTGEASGAVANFNTKIAAPLVDCTLSINAQQASGTPSPDNPLPISGFTGANVADTSDSIEKATYIKGIYEGVNGFVDLGSLTWTKASNNGRFYARFSSSDNIKPAQSTAYKVNAIINNYTVESQNTVATLEPDMSFSVDGNNPPFIQIVNKAYTDATDFSNYLSGKYLIYELATPEAPTITPVQFQTLCTSFDINGALISVDWTDDAGTVYGGELDLLSGVLTVTHASTTIDDLSILYWNGLFIAEISDKKIGLTNVICSIYKQSSGGGFAALNNLEIVGNPSTSYIYMRDDDYTDVTTFKQNRGTGVICYELLTPITYQLTPQQITAFVGENNIWHDTGNTDVEFKQDPQNYIDDKIANATNSTRTIQLTRAIVETPEETPDETSNER